MIHKRLTIYALLILTFGLIFSTGAKAQKENLFEVIEDKETLTAMIPQSFYFAGLSGGTQMRNAAVARFGEKHHVIAGLVDVSGYSTDISGIYEGFFITDSPVFLGGETLETGAYGFGFSRAGKVNIFDIGGKQILSVPTTKDEELRRPRPLMMIPAEQGIRLYKGRDFVVITPN